MPQDLSRIRELLLLKAIMSCPFDINQNTVPDRAEDIDESQVVGTLHLSLEKYKLLTREINKILAAEDPNKEKEIDRIAQKMCQDGMCRSMGEGRRLVSEVKARGLYPAKIKQLYEKQGKEFDDETV